MPSPSPVMKYLLTILVSVFFFLLTYASAPTEFLVIDLVLLGCHLVVVLTVELVFAHIFVRRRVIQNLILAVFATINILAVNLILNEDFIQISRYGQVLSLVLASFILFVFMRMQDDGTFLAKLLPAAFAVASAGVLVKALLSVSFVQELLIASELSIEDGKASSKNIRIVDFKVKPNVYFIAFDSIVPKVLLKKHMDMESTPYHDVLDDNFRRFRNFFADRTPTVASLNALLALDVGHYDEARINKVNSFFFSGVVPSPLFEIFKHNGYETTTLYRSSYFGNTKGPHVDNYLVGEIDLRRGVCEFIDTQGVSVLTFMGYCSLASSKMFTLILKKIGVFSQLHMIDYLIDNMRSGLQRDTPQLLVTYIPSPGHTGKLFDKKDKKALEKYKQDYLRRSESTARYLRKITSFLAKEDPEAIVYVFGDHGPYISRSETFEDDRRFYIQDKFGVYGGIYPRDRCAESFDKPYNEDYMTVSQGAHMIIRCLSGGESAFIKLEDYRLPKFESQVDNRYEDYLYE